MKQELLKGLTEEQITKIKACKNNEEILALAKEEGVELTDEQLEAVTGGTCPDVLCPKCHAPLGSYWKINGWLCYECSFCGHQWEEKDE